MLCAAHVKEERDALHGTVDFLVQEHRAERQIAFGSGVHFCLGSHLARMELRSLFGHLITGLASLEVTGPAPASKTPLVGGLKSLPIRYQLKPVWCWAA